MYYRGYVLPVLVLALGSSGLNCQLAGLHSAHASLNCQHQLGFARLAVISMVASVLLLLLLLLVLVLVILLVLVLVLLLVLVLVLVLVLLFLLIIILILLLLLVQAMFLLGFCRGCLQLAG